MHTHTHTQFYLEDFGAVLKGARVADIIDQADNVTSQISVRQVVEVREHFMKLRGDERVSRALLSFNKSHMLDSCHSICALVESLCQRVFQCGRQHKGSACVLNLWQQILVDAGRFQNLPATQWFTVVFFGWCVKQI